MTLGQRLVIPKGDKAVRILIPGCEHHEMDVSGGEPVAQQPGLVLKGQLNHLPLLGKCLKRVCSDLRLSRRARDIALGA